MFSSAKTKFLEGFDWETRNEFEKRLSRAWKDLNDATRTLEIYQGLVPAYAEVLEAIVEEYDEFMKQQGEELKNENTIEAGASS